MSDAKVLTTAEVESWQVALGRRWGARIGPRGHEVVIEGDRILATTRALEKAQTALMDVHDALHRECSGKADLPGEIRSLRARAEKAESERDEARGEARAHRAALDDATASCHGLGCGRCEDCVSMQRARAEKAESEHDAARARVAEFETVLLDACDAARAALAKAKGATNG